jgi:hypothetical protein
LSASPSIRPAVVGQPRADSVLERIMLTRVCDLDGLREDREVREVIAGFAPSYVLVALPKSSSTYCTRTLAATLGADVYKDIVTQDRFTPKDLSVPGIVAMRERVTVSQVHLMATGANLRIIRNFGLPVVILLRNIFDVVVSLRDHMIINPYFSSILIPNNYAAVSEADRLDYIIDTAVPWMITFYTSWAQALARGDVAAEMFFYEGMVHDPIPFFRRMCGCFGTPVGVDHVAAKLARVEKSVETRFNVGVPGRGQAELSAAQIARIRRHTDYYPGIDFSPLGL